MRRPLVEHHRVERKGYAAVPVAHTSKVPFVPALAAVFSVTVTVAVAFVHGAKPVTVYVYTPGVIVAGSY